MPLLKYMKHVFLRDQTPTLLINKEHEKSKQIHFWCIFLSHSIALNKLDLMSIFNKRIPRRDFVDQYYCILSTQSI